MIYIATYVIGSSNDKKIIEEAEDIEQEVLSFSTSVDKKKIVEYDNELKYFFLKEEYVEMK